MNVTCTRNSSGSETSPMLVEEIADIVSRQRQQFHKMAMRYLGNAADAEDAVQDALLKAIRNVDQFRGQARLSSWLMRIVINTSLMKLRKRMRESLVSVDALEWKQDKDLSPQVFLDHRPGPEEIVSRIEFAERVEEFAWQLSPLLRRTYLLRDVRELSICDSARILCVPEGTVKAQTVRARAKLRRMIERRPSAVRKNPAIAQLVGS